MFIVLLVFQSLVLTLCHIFITKVSFMFVESEVGRLANLSLFDVLEEQVLVVDQETKDILW